MLHDRYKHHHTGTLFIFSILVYISKCWAIYVVSMWSIFLFGVCVASGFGFAVWKIFLSDIFGFWDPKLSVQPLVFYRKKTIHFRPSCFHFHGNLSILEIGLHAPTILRRSLYQGRYSLMLNFVCVTMIAPISKAC